MQLTDELQREIQAPWWAPGWSLEEVAWCMDGVPDGLGDRVLSLTVNDERWCEPECRHATTEAAAEYHMNREPECDYSDPNMLHRQWGRLVKEDQIALVEIGAAYYEEGETK